MHRIAAIIALLLTCPAWAGRADRAEKADQILRMDNLLTIRIHMTAEQWRMMQPLRASRLATAMVVPQHPTTRQAFEAVDGAVPPLSNDPTPPDGERRLPGLAGYEYAYVSANVNVDGKTYKNVGVRYKGQWSYSLAAGSPRRPLKINFDHFVDKQRFHGIQSLSLSANAVDPSQLRESLSYAFFRDAGLPASRTCFALVYLTVDGIYNSEMLGLYTAIEEINKDFLHNHFGSAQGLLIRPERTRNLAYFGEDWKEYDRYNLQSDPTPFTASRFMGFTRVIHVADDEVFCSAIGDYIDAHQFLRFLAANVLMVNLDGVLVNGHNFYVYVHPETGRLAFMPWDLHYSFGTYGRTMDEWANVTIDRPYRNTNRLVDRIMSVAWMRDAYREYLREFATGCFSPEKMNARIDHLEQVVRKAEAIAKAEGRTLPITIPSGSPILRPDLKPFVAARVQSVLDQLAGRLEGDPLGGRPPPPPAPKRTPPPVTPVKPVPPPAIIVPATRPAPTTAPVIAKHLPVPPTQPALPKAQVAPATQPAQTARPIILPTTAPSTQRIIAKPHLPPATQPTSLAKPQPVPTTRPAIAKALSPTTLPVPSKNRVVSVKHRDTTPPKPIVVPKHRPVPPHPLAPMLVSTLDSDRDSQLDRDEVIDAAKHLFIANSRIRRGPVDDATIAATFDYFGRLLDPFPPPVNDDTPPEDPLRPRPSLTWAKAIMQRADTSKTGRATLENLLAAAERMFDEADADHNGLLTSREIGLFLDQLVPRQ